MLKILYIIIILQVVIHIKCLNQTTKKLSTKKSLTKNQNFKIIRPNCSIKKGIFNSKAYETTARKSLSSLTYLREDAIKYISHEKLLNNMSKILKCDMHPFVQAVHWAYSYHLPLEITPDMIWYLIISGVSIHINLNSDELRHVFVNHTDKKEIIVKRNDFDINKANNPWYLIVDQFTQNISQLTNRKIKNLIQNNFSTTNLHSRVVSQIVLMDSMSKYFEYKFQTMCGIPEIRVGGTKKDWLDIQTKMRQLISLMPKLKIWLNSLEEILASFVGLYTNRIDKLFWNQIYKQNEGSGGPYVTGWIVGLFPYLGEDFQKNMYVFESDLSWRNTTQEEVYGLSTVAFPYHMNQVPFKWEYFGKSYDMFFIGGFVGVAKNSDQTMKPLFGYAVSFNKTI